MTDFMTHFPLSTLSLLCLLMFGTTVGLVKGLALHRQKRRQRLQTLNLSTAPARVRQNLRRI